MHGYLVLNAIVMRIPHVVFFEKFHEFIAVASVHQMDISQFYQGVQPCPCENQQKHQHKNSYQRQDKVEYTRVKRSIFFDCPYKKNIY